MTRNEAVELMLAKVKNKNLRKHIFAVEAVMRGLAEQLNEDVELWGLTGILHDLDYEVTNEVNHTLITEEWLKSSDVPQSVINAVKAHADKSPCETAMDNAIYCADPVTGFLVACALIHPEKKLEPITAEFAKNRMKEKRFAAGASREGINNCAKLGIELDDFFTLSISSMKKITDVLGL